MTTDRQVIDRLRALNPVLDDTALDLPDTSYTAFLDALETRRKPMSVETQTQTQTPTQAPRPHRSRRFVVALAAAAVAAVAIVVGIAIAGSDGGDDVAAAPPLEVAEQILGAHAAGGPLAMLAFFEPGYAELERPNQEVFQIFNETVDLAELRCEETRPGRVLCRTPTTNDFHGAAGIDPDVSWTFTFNEESEVIALAEVAAQVSQIREFNSAFTEAIGCRCR